MDASYVYKNLSTDSTHNRKYMIRILIIYENYALTQKCLKLNVLSL